MKQYTLQELRTKGTSIILPVGTKFSVKEWSEDHYDRYSGTVSHEVFGTVIRNGEEHILTDRPTYTEDNFYCIPISELKHLGILVEDKIIGYKVPQDLYGGNIKKGQTVKSINRIDKWEVVETKNSGFLLPKEIVETWEPVYEEVTRTETTTLKHSTGELVLLIEPGKSIIVDGEGDVTKYVFQAENLLSILPKGTLGDWTIGVDFINIGCKKQIPVEDIQKALDIYNSK